MTGLHIEPKEQHRASSAMESSSPSQLPSFLEGAIFAAIGFALAIGAEFAVVMALSALFGGRLVPRGLGWIVFPFLGAGVGWKFGRQIGARNLVRIGQLKLGTLNSSGRLWLVASGLWIAAVCVFFLIFDPFGEYYWHTEEWIRFLFIVFGPPVLVGAGILGFNWATGADRG